jgi:hypothetical protein
LTKITTIVIFDKSGRRPPVTITLREIASKPRKLVHPPSRVALPVRPKSVRPLERSLRDLINSSVNVVDLPAYRRRKAPVPDEQGPLLGIPVEYSPPPLTGGVRCSVRQIGDSHGEPFDFPRVPRVHEELVLGFDPALYIACSILNLDTEPGSLLPRVRVEAKRKKR